MAKVKAKARHRKVEKAETAAVHIQHGDKHVVGVKSLRVLLCQDGDGWFAQGLEIDYAASGSTIEEVKTNFGEGLARTICEHVRMHGHIENLLEIAPQEAWKEYLRAPAEAIKAQYSTVTQFKCLENAVTQDDGKIEFPFDNIQFLEKAEGIVAS